MTSRIAITVSALTLGTALAATPSLAQTYGARNGPEVQQESTGTVPQQGSTSCVHFQQGCSDKPYPMASSNSERTGERANGTRQRLSSERTSGARTRVSGRERLGSNARVSERAGTSDEYMRSAAPEPSGARERLAGREGVRGETRGETYGFGERRDYYNAAPGAQVAGGPSGGIAMCETRFHSFDPATGTYLGFDGIRHACQ